MGDPDEFKYSTFNEQIENLWRLEKSLSRAASITKQEIAAAAQAVDELMVPVDNYTNELQRRDQMRRTARVVGFKAREGQVDRETNVGDGST